MQGLVHIYYGYGQGKTSAATGLAVRAAGSGLTVHYLQFLKGRSSGEHSALRQCGIEVQQAQQSPLFLSEMTEEQKQLERRRAERLLRSVFSDAAAGLFDLLILDEVIDAASLGILPEDLLCRLIKDRPENLEVVLTGHSLPDDIRDLADYITEFTAIRHPYEKGIAARRGIEF